MRRPRSKLEVSTFPFLAVLLCAMGSLMLFLFIMDRRAKLVEHNRALAAREAFAAAKLVQTQAERDARQAEWEKAKEKLHQLLLEQQQQLLAEANGIQEELANANKKLQIVRSQYLSAEGQLQGETGRILLLQSQLDNERAGVKKVEKKEVANKAELAKATQELLELTAALELLKTQKVQEKDVYSVVPYRGKRGDLRPPIYVECARDGLIFHPEKTLLDNFHYTPSAFLAEVERYAGPLAAARQAKQKEAPVEEKKGPYVLFLVRPDGIGIYYRAQGVLRGIDIDYGYELVDEGWVLDFSGGGAVPKSFASQLPPAPRPSKVPAFLGPSYPGDGTGLPSNQGPSVGPGGIGGGPGGTGSGLPSPFATGPQGIGSGPGGGSGMPSPFATGPQGIGGGPGGGTGMPSPFATGPQGIGGGPGGAGIGLPSPYATGPQGIGAGPGGTGIGSPSPFATGPQGMSAGPGGAGNGLPSPYATGPQGLGNAPGGTGNSLPAPYATGPQGVGNGAGGGGPSVSMRNGAPGGVGLGNSYSGTGMPNPSGAATSSQDSTFAPFSRDGTGPPGGSMVASGLAPGVIATSGLPASSGSGTGGGNYGGGGSAGSGPTGSGGGSPGAAGSLSSPNSPSSPSPNGPSSPTGGGAPASIGISFPGGNIGLLNPNSNPAPSPTGPSNDPGTQSAAGTGMSFGMPAGQSGGAAGDSGGPNLNRSPLPQGFGPAPTRGPAPPPLSKILGNKDFTITIDCYADHVNVFPGGMTFRWTAQSPPAVDQALVQSVSKLIERRQASVRPGEPPYRPLIRFQVLPDGLRSYYHVYPLLESLRVPMTRENVQE